MRLLFQKEITTVEQALDLFVGYTNVDEEIAEWIVNNQSADELLEFVGNLLAHFKAHATFCHKRNEFEMFVDGVVKLAKDLQEELDGLAGPSTG